MTRFSVPDRADCMTLCHNLDWPATTAPSDQVPSRRPVMGAVFIGETPIMACEAWRALRLELIYDNRSTDALW
jgi:hypothetical protein